MQRVRLYFLDSTIIDGFIDDTQAGAIRLVDLLNTTAQKRKFGESECFVVRNGIQMIFVKKNKEDIEDIGTLEFADEDSTIKETEVPLDFVLDNTLELFKTISLENMQYSVNLDQLVFAHSLSEFQGAVNERVRAQKTMMSVKMNVMTINNYLCEGSVSVPAIAVQRNAIPKDINVGKKFVAMSKVKLRYVNSNTNFFRFHDHLLINTRLVKAFY